MNHYFFKATKTKRKTFRMTMMMIFAVKQNRFPLMFVVLVLLLIIPVTNSFFITTQHANNKYDRIKSHNHISSLSSVPSSSAAIIPSLIVLSSTSLDKEDETATETTDPNTMRIKEIKDELNTMGISFKDCFDKDSLVERLIDARSGKVFGEVKKEEEEKKEEATNDSSSSSSRNQQEDTTKESETTTTTKTTTSKGSKFDRDAFATELRSKRVRELRTMCASNNIRWANMIEKEELVQALCDYQEKAADFSPSGKLIPGKVAVIDDEILTKELTPGSAVTPLLLDVYATWCGPCQMMAPFLEEAASELGDKVRVAKMDSDQNSIWPTKLQVQGLPTVIVFDGQTGKELERVEGALMKDQLIQFVMKHV